MYPSTMKNSKALLGFSLLLFATAIQPATTPVDEWTGWTIYSLVAAVGCAVALIVMLIRQKKSKEE